MTDLLWITTTDLKNNTNIEQNVDDHRLKQAILTAQNIHIQELLGSAWYDSLAAKRTAQLTWTGLTSAEDTFINNYLNFAIRAYAYAEYLTTGNFNITNQGIEKQSGGNSENASMEENESLTRKAFSNARFYGERCTRHICLQDTNTFPLYDNNDQNPHPNTRGPWRSGNFTSV